MMILNILFIRVYKIGRFKYPLWIVVHTVGPTYILRFFHVLLPSYMICGIGFTFFIETFSLHSQTSDYFYLQM